MIAHINYQSTQKKLEESWLQKEIIKQKDLADDIFFPNADDIKDASHTLLQTWEVEAFALRKYIESILESPEMYTWKIGKWSNSQIPLFSDIHPYGSRPDEIILPTQMEDLMLATGSNIAKIIGIDGIKNYRNFWFDSMIDFILACEIMIKQVGKSPYWQTPFSFSRNGFQTEIWASLDGDFRLSQSDIQQYPVLSPFWKQVHSRPALENTIAWYHSVETHFLWTLLRYAHQVWYKLSLNELIDFSHQYGNHLGPFWESGGDRWYDKMHLEIACTTPILDRNHNNHKHHIPTDPGHGSLYSIFLDGDKLLIGEDVNHIQAQFTPEDIPDLIKAIMVQCSLWLGRTSKQRIMETLSYYFSQEFQIKLA